MAWRLSWWVHTGAPSTCSLCCRRGLAQPMKPVRSSSRPVAALFHIAADFLPVWLFGRAVSHRRATSALFWIHFVAYWSDAKEPLSNPVALSTRRRSIWWVAAGARLLLPTL